MSIWRQTNSRIDLIKDSKGDGLSVADSDDDNEDEDNNENENDDFDRESNSEFEEYSDSDEDDYDEESEDDDDDIPSDQEFGESARRAKPASEISNERKSGDGAETSGGDANGSAAGGEAKWPAPNLGPETHGPTDPGFDCEAAGEKLLINETIHAPLGVVANLLFGDNVKWITKFITDTEKNFDLKNFGAFDSGLAAGSKRVYEYIKPLNGPVGPKQTKCMCTDTIEHWDLDGHITVITKTSTPDVPSGGAFTTKTRYTLYWADGNATRLMLSYLIDWTGKSWFKGPIEKGTHDGQMVMANHLIKDIETSIKKGGAVSKAKVNKGKKGKAPGKKKKTTSLKSGKARSEASEAALKGWLTQIVDLLQINPIPMVSVPLWGVLLIVLFLYLLFSRLFGGPGADHYTNSDMFHLGRDKFSRDKLELLRLQEEYNVWHWLDDRSNGIGIGFSEISAAGKRDAMARSQLHVPSFDKAKYYEQDLREAIKLTELRVRELKRVLNM